MKKFCTSILLFFITFSIYAQLPDHTPMMNKYWDLLNTRTIKKNASGMYEPYYPPALMAVNKKPIYLSGYMVPLKTGAVHKTFLLSVLPVAQCQFCGEGDIPEMVEVFMEEPLKFTSKPINIEGVLNINQNPDGASFQLLNGKLKK
ncbi:hypothetical protein Pedsa_3423 [Pseudopedobacter saltans DSM 12145]|uniref:DUF3299 domain-containing protein n=1 Tax=Pseudopedobacter saltans (strain ATCC 51119 / DSM 12145 / JCM 21818 / CCUG 39354 / LMG 10337 / NBRC 100064 / NCIMB 13643) TaxID=762903 RepID=F0SDH4_PSESL|nr:hypothetical protein [Pseudopedobacter saltans]ADY53957.1 hypothetical protein Pedsa_3423 [Pseudopedobacter saltans DSM 12145]